MSGPRVRLVVTGDDFGYCPRRDRGMVEAFVAGALSEVSLLVNGAAASSAAQLARRHRIPAGLHANLSEGRPVSLSAGSGASLLGPSGCFLGKTGFREALAAGQVREELRAQLSRFRDLVGREPTHVDGHQHVHVLPGRGEGGLPVPGLGEGGGGTAGVLCRCQVGGQSPAPIQADAPAPPPGVRQVFAEVLREYGVRYTRVPVERGLHRCEWLEPQLQTFAVALEKDALAAREEFQELGLRCPDAFIGLSTMGKDMSVSRIEAAIDQAVESIQIPEDALKGGRAITLELMAHPGYPSVSPVGGCGEGPDDFSQSWERLHELQTLLDPTLHNFYRQRGIKLCAFEDL
ncbi:carbohydrate deacetylase isoform X3 [Monodelphis domestica]|uniref:carbohydrate deacetylase isoform X3 n=1 Tax=Monodelphis domestica TaxID=13616 RepID=UPI0024E2141F|nr:carbohydrate deacetylase isoform X3 [Monodelphis domestica]